MPGLELLGPGPGFICPPDTGGENIWNTIKLNFQKSLEKHVFNDTYAIFWHFFIKAYVVGTQFELPEQVEAIQMRPITYVFDKEVDKSTLAIIQRLLNCLTVRL